MAIFPSLKTELVVQVGDRTRLNASYSFVTPDEPAISKIEIQPEAAASFYDVNSDQFLDWQFSTEGETTATVRVTADPEGEPEEAAVTFTVITEIEDALFSSDADLLAHEPDVLKYLPAGRNTFKDVHRRAQTFVLKWLDQKGIRDSNGARLTKDAIVDKEEVNLWATYIALRLIFDGLSNAVDDIFAQKALGYGRLESQARDRAFLSLDIDGDGTASEEERVQLSSVKVIRR